MPEIIIIGAGLTGLSSAYHLKKPFIVLEKNKTPGGLCGSVAVNGFTFDYSGHLLHLREPRVKTLLSRLMPAKLDSIYRKASVFTNSRYVPYPFQANLYYMPEKIRKACLEGFLKRDLKHNYGHNTDFLSWSKSFFGEGITRYFMKPYNEKLWTVSGKILTADWVAPFVPRPDTREIVNGATSEQKKDFGYNVSYYYPDKGGCQSVINAFYNKLDNVRLGIAAGKIEPKQKYILSSDGNKFHYDHLVSTQPLVELLNNIVGLPSDVAAASGKFELEHCRML